jgi:hypothetical protein
MFRVRLTEGPHQVVVQHVCCDPAEQEIVVTPNRPGQLYQLSYGRARPAVLKVLNAPAGARVLVDGVLLGTTSDPELAIGMTRPDRRVTVTVGDRTLTKTIKANEGNIIDYNQATP